MTTLLIDSSSLKATAVRACFQKSSGLLLWRKNANLNG
jgi:hypothetical protein